MRVTAIVLACLVTAVSVFFFITRSSFQAKMQEPPQVIAKELQAEREGRYYNERYGFSFKTPEGARIHERKEGADAATIRVENEKEEKGFQVFVLAYAKDVISEERFRMDLPSGVREQEEAILLDGVPATTFVSKDATLGTTREIWFLRQGYLYEITAPISSEVWLQEVLLTWKFEELMN